MNRELIGPMLIILALVAAFVITGFVTRRRQKRRWREMNNTALAPKR